MAQAHGPDRRPTFLAATALACLVCVLFSPIVGYDFMAYDTPAQIVENPHIQGLTAENLKTIFTSRCVSSYYPVRTLTYAIDHQIWGLRPGGFKLTNGLIHLGNVLLLYGLILRLFHRPAGLNRSPRAWWDAFAAAAGAGLFAVHPVVVEPVAWVPGREELLMTLGALGCLHFHLGARRFEGEEGKGRAAMACRVGAALSCAAACLSNAVAAVIPLVIVAWDLLTLSGPRLRRTLSGTSALWVIALMTLVIKSDGHDVSGQVPMLSAERLMLIPNLYWVNLMTLVWPRNLMLVYPNALPESFLDAEVILGGLAIGLSLLLLWALRRRPLIVFGLVWFGVALGPTSQVMPHMIHRADRFLYLPLAGLALALAMGVRPLENTLRGRVTAVVVAAAGVVCLLGVISAGQVRTWRDTLSVWANTLSLRPDNPTAHAGIGYQLAKCGRMREAVEHYEISIRVQPKSKDVLIDFALDLTTCAEEELRDYERAVELAARACELTEGKDPNCRRALAVVHANYAKSLVEQNEFGRAVAHYLSSLQAHPNHQPALFQLAAVLATCTDPRLRNPAEAVPLAERGCILSDRKDPVGLMILAMTYAEAGRLERAVATAEEAIRLAQAVGNAELVEQLRVQLTLYRNHVPVGPKY